MCSASKSIRRYNFFLHSVKNVTIAELFSADRATGFALPVEAETDDQSENVLS